MIFNNRNAVIEENLMNPEKRRKAISFVLIAMIIIGIACYFSYFVRGFCLIFIPFAPIVFVILYYTHIRYMRFLMKLVYPSPIRPRPIYLSKKLVIPPEYLFTTNKENGEKKSLE